MKESDIQKSILSYLKANGHLVWRTHTGPLLGYGGRRLTNPLKGYPDISGVHRSKPGHLFVIEVKSEKGVMSQEQISWRESLIKAGATHIVARSLEDVIKQL